VIGVTADTNVYISALLFGGPPRVFLNAARKRNRIFQLAISQPLLKEVQRVLRDKFNWSETMLHEESVRLLRFARQVTPHETITAVFDDPDDDHVLECAVAADSRFIVTGDGDLLRLGQYRDNPDHEGRRFPEPPSMKVIGRGRRAVSLRERKGERTKGRESGTGKGWPRRKRFLKGMGRSPQAERGRCKAQCFAWVSVRTKGRKSEPTQNRIGVLPLLTFCDSSKPPRPRV
jgi:putative PIN family toxin of toxin-antitoxin system